MRPLDISRAGTRNADEEADLGGDAVGLGRGEEVDSEFSAVAGCWCLKNAIKSESEQTAPGRVSSLSFVTGVARQREARAKIPRLDTPAPQPAINQTTQ